MPTDPHLYNSKPWAKACVRGRTQRKIRAGEHSAKRVRNVKHELAKADIEERRPGEARQAFPRAAAPGHGVHRHAGGHGLH